MDAIIEENNTEGTAEARPVKPENEDAMYDTDLEIEGEKFICKPIGNDKIFLKPCFGA